MVIPCPFSFPVPLGPPTTLAKRLKYVLGVIVAAEIAVAVAKFMAVDIL